MTRLSENFSLVYVLKPADHEAGATGDSIHIGLLHSVAFLVAMATMTGDAVLTVKSGASAGTETTAETFRYRLSSADQAAANADQFGTWATSSSLTLTAATYSDRLLVIELDADQVTDGQPWVTLALSDAASAATASVVALGAPRYAGNVQPTVI